MKLFAWALVAWLALAGSGAQADIRLASVIEARGGGALAGGSFRLGYQMAIDELNARGGVLGQRLAITEYPIDTDANAARAAADMAVSSKPFAIIGPVFSDMMLAAMARTRDAGVPHFTGAEATSISKQFHPGLLRTSLTLEEGIPRLAAFVVNGLGARKLALLRVDNEFGRSGQALLSRMAAKSGSTLKDVAVPPGTKDMTDFVRQVQDAAPEALVLYLNEDESIAALKALRAAGFARPIIGSTPVASPRVVEAAGSAAEGVFIHAGLSPDAGGSTMAEFVGRFRERHGRRPDPNAIKGWLAVQALRAGIEEAGKLDPATVLQRLKADPIKTSRHPDLLITPSLSYDFFGDLNCDSHILAVVNGRVRLLATIGIARQATATMLNGQTMVINTSAFRQALQSELDTLRGDAPPAAGRARP
jgi:branched-chain amino acid transport system substrate-binding protein